MPTTIYPLLLMKLLHGLFTDLFLCFSIAALPTLRALWNRPSMLLSPGEISRTFMSYVWIPFGDGIDENSRQDKEQLIGPWASGVVLEIGAAHGHLAKYLDRSRVTAYVALEPNVLMHDRLRTKAHEAGFDATDGSFLLLPCGAEEIDRIGERLDEWAHKTGRSTTDGEKVIDTLVSILTLCSLPPLPSSCSSQRSYTASTHSTPPAELIRAIQTRVLRPGGQLLFYEHVRSPIPTIARAQDFLAPLWRNFFDGCTIGVDSVRAVWEAGFESNELGPTRPSDSLAEKSEKDYENWMERDGVKCWKAASEKDGGWAEMYVWGKKDEEPESLFWHQSGRCVKRD